MTRTNAILMELREMRKALASGGHDRMMHSLRRQSMNRNSEERQVALIALAYLRRSTPNTPS